MNRPMRVKKNVDDSKISLNKEDFLDFEKEKKSEEENQEEEVLDPAKIITVYKRGKDNNNKICFGSQIFSGGLLLSGQEALFSNLKEDEEAKSFLAQTEEGKIYYGRLDKKSAIDRENYTYFKDKKIEEIPNDPEKRKKFLKENNLKEEEIEKILVAFQIFKLLENRFDISFNPDSLIEAKEAIQSLEKIEKLKGIVDFQEEKRKIAEALTLPDFQDFQEESLEKLEELQVVEFGPQKEIIVDTRKIVESFDQIYDFFRKKERFKPYFNQGKLYVFHYIFRDRPVISREDWQKGKREAKPFFYEPKTMEDAFDLSEIKESDFYLNYGELKNLLNINSLNYPPHKDLKFSEGVLSSLIYHPKYGDGYRDEKGKLMVRDKDGQYKKFSAEWLLKNPFFNFRGGQIKEKGLKQFGLSVPRLYLQEFASHLLQADLLRETDFEIRADSLTSKKYRDVRNIGNRGYVMFGGIRYYIGREFENKPEYKVYKLSEELGGITTIEDNSEEKLTHIFNLTDLEDSRLKQSPGDYARAQKDITETREYDPAEFNKRKINESVEDYLERLKTVDNFNNLLLISGELSQETGINLTNLSFKEQQYVAANFDILKERKEEIIEFSKKFGLEGLRVFLSLEYDLKIGDKILEIGKNLPSSEARRFFADYTLLVDFTNVFASGLSPEFKRRLGNKFNSDEWYEHLLRRAKEYLQKIYELGLKSRWQLNYVQATEKLQQESPHLQLEMCHQAVTEEVAITLANNFGTEEIRDILNQTKVPEADAILAFINPEVSPEIHRDLKELYNRIRFEEYKINEKMTDVDLQYLRENLLSGGAVLDLGCGTGRHLKPLYEAGYQVDGLDYVKRHVELTQAAVPGAKIVQGDWTNTSFRDASYQTIYSLGRNILHEFQMHRQDRLFTEINRLLSIGGKFIFDIPDREKGGYAVLVNSYARKLNERQITNFRPGTIYDSPDGQNFFTRYAFSREDIIELAKTHGFEVESIKEEPLATNKGDVNIYYTWRKVKNIDKE